MTAVEIVMPRLSDAMQEGTIIAGETAALSEHVRTSSTTPADLQDGTFTLACHHRAVYGADGAAFLARLRALLESPEVLVL